MGRNDALNKVLNGKHIIQPIRRTRKDIVLQVFFVSDRNPTVHIIGWANWEDLDQYRTIRYVAGRPRDFWMVPFNEPIVHTPFELISVLRDWS
jgi:hypothetical protein